MVIFCQVRQDPKAGPKGVTKPQPFHLSQARKRKTEDEPQQKLYKTVAEQLRDFSTKTPERFHSHPHGKGRLIPHLPPRSLVS